MRWTTEFVVGLFVVGAIALFSYFTIQIGDFSLKEREKWTVRFDDASGLKDGDPVLALGARVGKVARLELRDDHVLAHLELTEHVTLREDHRIDIRAPSILASFHVHVTPGSPDKPRVQNTHDLVGQSAGGLFGDALEKAVAKLQEKDGALGKLLVGEQGYADVQETIRHAKDLAAKLEKADGALGNMLFGTEAHSDLTAALKSARTLAADLEKADGALGQMLLGKEAAADLTKTLDNAEHLSTDLAKMDGALGRMLVSDATRQNIEKTVANAASFSDGLAKEGGLGKSILSKETYASLSSTLASADRIAGRLDKEDGHLGKMLVGEKAHTDLAGALSGASDTMKEIREVAEKVNKGEGTLAKLINDAAIYNDVQKTVSTLREVAESLSDGKGTLGKLVTDSGVYDTAQKVLTQISEAIEDTREQAPVATFTQTMLGGFR